MSSNEKINEKINEKNKSKYWKDMFILNELKTDELKTDELKTDELKRDELKKDKLKTDELKTDIIISEDPPIGYSDDKNIKLFRNLNENELIEFCDFINAENKTVSNNITLLPLDEFKKFINLGVRTVIARGGNQNKLLGTIMSIPFPIKIKDKIIIHGCTTFLNIHHIIRNHGICMALIRELIQYGYEEGLFCDYHLVPKPIGNNSLIIDSYYLPINLKNAVNSGFYYPFYKDKRKERLNRLKYKIKYDPTKTDLIKLDKSNKNPFYSSYLEIIETLSEKKFVFYPDLELWTKWIENFPTFILFENSKVLGFFSLHSLYCKMESNIEVCLCLPTIFIPSSEDKKEILWDAMIWTINNLKYDVAYFYQIGFFNKELLENKKCIKTDTPMYFSMYNNKMSLNPEDILAPLL